MATITGYTWLFCDILKTPIYNIENIFGSDKQVVFISGHLIVEEVNSFIALPNTVLDQYGYHFRLFVESVTNEQNDQCSNTVDRF